jgi:hypothetical protein
MVMDELAGISERACQRLAVNYAHSADEASDDAEATAETALQFTLFNDQEKG